MKIRNGFVSNSSSSSFIVVFDKRPDSVEELKDMMFPNNKNEDTLCYYGEPETISTIVETVYKDIEYQEKGNISSLSELMNSFNNYSIWTGKIETRRDEYVLSDKELVDKIEEKLIKFAPLEAIYWESNNNKDEEFRKEYFALRNEIYCL